MVGKSVVSVPETWSTSPTPTLSHARFMPSAHNNRFLYSPKERIPRKYIFWGGIFGLGLVLIGDRKQVRAFDTPEIDPIFVCGEFLCNYKIWMGVEENSLKKVKEGIRKGESVNLTNGNGITVLMRATSKQQESIVRCLLKNGADPNRKALDVFDGETALYYAASTGNVTIAKLLVSYGAEKNPKCHQNTTYLLTALLPGSTYGFTPLDIAKKNKHKAMINYLERINS